MPMTKHSLVLLISLIFYVAPVCAGEVLVAVASNFAQAAKHIAQRFEASSGHQVVLVFGATGKQYAQVQHGAPFDIFLAADSERPKLLEQQGKALPGSRFTYAVGKVVLWSPQTGVVDSQAQVLHGDGFRFVAVANPKLAPYGKAAEQVLRGRGLWVSLRGRMVRGENIAQTFQFVKSGNAELGFIAYSQIKHPGKAIEGSFWLPPQSLYDPIEQQAVLLTDNPVARDFLLFVQSDEVLDLIRGFGYGTS